MIIEQIYTGCLAQGAYYIHSEGEAVIIDPLREVQPYLDRAAKDGVTIKYVFETHFHADFVSGHVTLAQRTGAPIVSDLAQKSDELTMEDLAGYAYDSLRNKIMPLPDDVIVYPAHGAGSACGKNMMKETVDTLGNQKKVNYALRADMTKDAFIKEVTADLLPPPAYFPLNVKLNKEGYQDIDTVVDKGLTALNPREFKLLAEEGSLMLDVRKPNDFAGGNIPNSIFIGLDGSFAPWVGELIVDVKQPIILIAPEGREEEAITRLSRVGFDNILGYLKGGLATWKTEGLEVERVDRVTAAKLQDDYEAYSDRVYDVRRTTEYQSEHISAAHSAPLSKLNDHLANFPEEKFYIHCAGGYRSMIAASILKSRGYHNFFEVEGGFKAIRDTTLPRTDYVCPTTL